MQWQTQTFAAIKLAAESEALSRAESSLQTSLQAECSTEQCPLTRAQIDVLSNRQSTQTHRWM